MYRAFLICLLLCGCSPDLEDRRLELEEELGQGKAGETLSRIDLTIQEANRARSLKISDTSLRRNFQMSLDASSLVYNENNLVFRLASNKPSPTSLSLEFLPERLLLSGRGQSGIAMRRTDQNKCLFQAYLLASGKVFDPFQDGCLNLPAITDAGMLFRTKDRHISAELLVEQNRQSQTIQSDMPPDLPLTRFVPLYKKISNKFVLRSLPDNSLLIFFGRAGYYDLYHYPGFGTEIKKILSGVVRPTLTGEVPFFNIQKRDQKNELALRPVKKSASYFIWQKKGAHYELARLVQEKEKFTLKNSIRINPEQKLVYLGNEQSFLMSRRNLICVWKPGKPYRYLPLISTNFALFESGLVFEDFDRKLYHRKTGFEQTELDLLKLKFDAENLAEADKAQAALEKATEEKEPDQEGKDDED